uniref:Cytochrome P450 n=1 Tax=Palpitomonas bilix TaxID=652834 RepID=A0A7S3DKK1_9EUKA|mmetsp:Transcript_4178/g.8232  ORF Transcript_4178/g.8232 Transcript_4178/m.8232 type:complete len:510 (+) Transcript_4178:152-1681(+)
MKLQDYIVGALTLPVLAPIAVFRGLFGLSRYLWKKGAYSSLPQVEGYFPIATLFEPGKMEDILDKLRRDDGSYPDMFSFGFYYHGDCSIAVTNPALLREIFTHDSDFPKIPESNGLLEVFVGKGLVNTEGALWKHDRKLLTPVFHFDALTHGVPKIVKVCLKKYEELEAAVKKADSDCGKGCHVLGPVGLFSDMTLRVIIAYAFGDHMPADDMQKAFHEMLQPLDEFFAFYMLVGSLSLQLPLTASAITRRAKAVISKMVEERVLEALARRDRGEKAFDDNNLLETIIQNGEKGMEKETVEKAVAQGLTFLFAGHDTTSNLLSFALDYLSRPEYRHYQEEIRQEAMAVFGDLHGFEHADRSAAQKLVLCERVLEETLRLAPPAPFIERMVKKDMKLGNVEIKAGTAVLPLFYCTHRDSRFWKDPDTFNPHRFSDEQSVGRKNFSFVPFSAGGRNCIGQKLSLLEAKLILSSLLMKFEVVSVQDGPPPRGFTFTMSPLKFEVGLRLRSEQ